MAALAGRGGKVVVGAADVVAEIGEWSFNPAADLIEKTKFGDTWHSNLHGLNDGDGSFAGRWDMTDAAGQLALQNAMLAGTEVTLRLYVNGANYYSGPALIKTTPIKAAVDTAVEIEFSFQCNGAWSYT